MTNAEVSDLTNADATDPHGTVADVGVLSDEERTNSAERIIQDHVLMSLVSGLIPAPGIDLVAAFTVQLTMLKRMAALYDVPFRQDAAKSIVTSLFGTLGGAGAAGIVAGSFIKTIPVVGTVVGMTGTSIGFAAFTFGIGKVFQRHFELGGTFIDLDPKAYRDYFRDMNWRGRAVAKEKTAEAEEVAEKKKNSGSRRAAKATAED